MAMTPAMHSASPLRGLPAAWWSKGLFRFLLLLFVAAVVAAIVAAFGIARDYGYLRASILTGSAGAYHHDLTTRLANRAKRKHGNLAVIPTAGSIEIVGRLTSTGSRCEKFALIHDGIPVSRDAGLQLLGRLPWSSSRARVPLAPGQIGPRLSDLRRLAGSVHRDWPGGLGHGVPYASTLRGSGSEWVGCASVEPRFAGTGSAGGPG